MIPLKAVAASHDPGHITRILIAEGAGKKLHSFIDNGSRYCAFGCGVCFSARLACRWCLGLLGFVVIEENLSIPVLEQECVFLSSSLEWINQEGSAGRVGTNESLVEPGDVHANWLASRALRKLQDQLLRKGKKENRAA